MLTHWGQRGEQIKKTLQFYFLIAYGNMKYKLVNTCLVCLELLNLNVQGTNNIKSMYPNSGACESCFVCCEKENYFLCFHNAV